MKVFVYCLVIVVLHTYSIEAKGRRFKSCRELEEICINRKLAHFEKRYKSKTVCLEKHEPVFHSNGSLLKGYYTIGDRKSCNTKGVVQVHKICVNYVKEKPGEGLLHVVINETCSRSSFRSYYKKRQKLKIKANVVCSSKKRIRHTKCGKFRNGDYKNSTTEATTEGGSKSTMVSTSTPNHTIIESSVSNSTNHTSWFDLDKWNIKLDDKNSSRGLDDSDNEPSTLELSIISLLLAIVLIVLLISCILFWIYKRRKPIRRRKCKGRLSRLICLKRRKNDKNRPVLENRTAARQSKLDEIAVQPLSSGVPITSFSGCEGRTPDFKKEIFNIYQHNRKTEKEIPLNQSVQSSLLFGDLELNTHSSENEDMFNDLYSGSDSDVWNKHNKQDTACVSSSKTSFLSRFLPRFLSRFLRRNKQRDTDTDLFNDLYSGSDNDAWLNKIHVPESDPLTVIPYGTKYLSSPQTNFNTTSEYEINVPADSLPDYLLSTQDNTTVDSIITCMPTDKYSSDLDNCFDELYSGNDCDAWLNEIPDLSEITAISDKHGTGYVSSSQNNFNTTSEHAINVPTDSSQPDEANTAIKHFETVGSSKSMPFEKHTSRNSTNSIVSTLSSEPNWLDEMDNKECLKKYGSSTHDNIKYNHDYFENLPRSLEPNKPNRLSMPIDVICSKPVILYSLRKANSEPDFLWTSSTDVRHLRRSYGKRTDFYEAFHSRNVTKEWDDFNYSEFDFLFSAENDILNCTGTDKRASPDNTSLRSGTSRRLDSSGSSISTRIRLGDTSHLFQEECGENDQEEEESQVDENDQDVEEEREDQEKEDHERGVRYNNNFKTMGSKKQNTVTAIKNDLSESVKTFGGKTLSLGKESNQRDQNDFRSYYQDGGTQTKSQNLPRTIFNTDWTAEASFDVRGGELQTENSSVKLIVNPDTVTESESITINAHVHVNIKKLAEVLEIPMDESIVSPAPEYHLNADWKKVIKKPMIIQLPVVLPPTFITENLRVYVFQSKDGQVGKYPIGEKSKQNDNDEDSFFEVSEDRKNILIYTYHFSGVVVCYKCSKEVLVPGYLNARIKGSNKPQKNGREVRIRYEIFDEKNGIKDFEAQIHPENVHNGLVLIEERVRINLPAKVDNDSKMIIKLDVIGSESHLWECKKRPSGRNVYPLEKEVFIRELVPCSVHIDSFYTEFVMCAESTKEPLQPFECIINVYEKDAAGTEGAAAISSSNESYLKLSDQLGTEAVTLSHVLGMLASLNSRDKETEIYPEQVTEYTREQLLGRVEQGPQANRWAQSITQPPIHSLEIRSNNRSMPELHNTDYAIGIQEVGSRQASHHSDVSEFTDGPQAMAELDLNQTDRRSPCENSDIDEYSVRPNADQDQTVPKEH